VRFLARFGSGSGAWIERMLSSSLRSVAITAGQTAITLERARGGCALNGLLKFVKKPPSLVWFLCAR
jgi:hypothetical protein